MFKFPRASHSRVEGQFPTDETDGVIPKSWLLQAGDRYNANPQSWDDLATSDIWRLGLDVGGGQDNLVMESFLSQYCLLVLWGSGNSYCIYSDKIYT
ncbi:hypothetical protein HW132_24895 [Brasilonema sp. CT11]|nr:hypothetical protein [Brasilonema sp. CT11]